MRLKSIDIQGFKSFPDRTRLDFDDGITAVIGPNGSGKSNIADAVRWVLGEQSTRTLRGGRMEDVIFGGTQTRKAQGVASVTLVIDNADRSLPCDADEVAVTRRLYRSGDSEYRINATQVRLKDVSELLMDTGLGRDGYSIIGQGRISEIVSARAKERREIFEEAAGISKFRFRKTEAERRLELAESNMVRLRDILAELDGRIGPLKSQAQKARRFLDLDAEKKKLEVSAWMQSLSALQKRAAALEDKLLLAQAQLGEADEALAECGRQFSAETERGRLLTLDIEEKRAQGARLAEQATAWESQAAVLENDIGHHRRTIEEIEEAAGQAGHSQQELKAGIEASQALAAEKARRLSELAEQAQQLAAQAAALEQKQQAAAAVLEQLRLRRAGVFEAIEAAKLDAAASATLLGESQTRLESMSQTRQARQQAVESARQECGECEALLKQICEREVSLKNSAEGYQRKRQGRGEKLSAMDEEIAALERKAQEKRQRASLLTEMDRNLEGFGQGVRHIMTQARSGALAGVHGPVSSLLTAADEHALAIETALGGALQHIVVDDEQTGKRAIGLLRYAKAGRATFLPITSVKGNRLSQRGLESAQGFVGLACDLVKYEARYEGIVCSLLGHIAVAQDLDAAVDLAKHYGYRFRVVTLDGQVVNAGGSMTGGFAVRSAGLLGRRKEIEQLTQEAQRILTERHMQAQRRQEAARELAALQAELDAIEAQQKTCAEDKIRCREQLSAAGLRLSQAEEQAAELALEQKLLGERIEEIRQKSGGADELAERLSAELDRFQREIAQGAEAREETAGLIAQLAVRQGDCGTQTALIEHELAAARQELARLEELVSTGEAQRAGLLERAAALTEQIGQAETERSRLLETSAQARRDIRTGQDEVLSMMRRRDQSEQRCTELRAREREETARRDGLFREAARLSEQKNAVQNEHGALVDKLYDEYELTRSDAEDIAEPIEDLPAANRRLAELRASIRGLGAVNVDAIAEYAEVSARHAALSKQMRDIERSKEELTGLIGDLTGRMREIFAEKFNLINRHFGRIFIELFEGGSASLSLSEPDDLLESGIEISVHPPGKLIKNLASLSGGEQAFVAIAIFFAVLKVNPSPFCVMDEIEAALDDVNVAKFAAYLHTLTDKTQFIAITHRRGTMEAADVLYGVAMQEEGVSKLIQLRVTEIEKRLGIR